MQVLKDEVRNSIMRTARAMFLEAGFEKTSMKDIALKVGVAVGNLYRYYPNKESLLEAIALPAYDKLMQLIRSSEKTPHTDLTVLEQVGNIFSELVYEHREDLLILLYGSQGTRYGKAKEEFISHLAERTARHLLAYNEANPAFFQVELAKPLAVAFLEGYFEIIRLHTDQEQISRITKQYITVLFTGLNQIL